MAPFVEITYGTLEVFCFIFEKQIYRNDIHTADNVENYLLYSLLQGRSRAERTETGFAAAARATRGCGLNPAAATDVLRDRGIGQT